MRASMTKKRLNGQALLNIYNETKIDGWKQKTGRKK